MSIRIIGVDGGLAHMGLADLDVEGTGNLMYRGGCVVETKPSAKKHGIRKGDDNMRRARELTRAFLVFLDAREAPIVVCYEAQSFGMRGQIAARQAATAFGLLAGVCEVRKLAMLCVSPQAIKAAMCPGVKNASKVQVIDAVDEKFRGFVWPTRGSLWEHLADAVGAVYACKDDELVRAALAAARGAA